MEKSHHSRAEQVERFRRKLIKHVRSVMLAREAEEVRIAARERAATFQAQRCEALEEHEERIRQLRQLKQTPEYKRAVWRAYWHENSEHIHRERRRRYSPERTRARADRRKLSPNYRTMKRLAKHRRRARKKSVIVQRIPVSFWPGAVLAFGGLCAYCSRACGAPEMDHFTPLARGGAHAPHNLVPSCKSCNSAKGDRDPFSFLHDRKIAFT